MAARDDHSYFMARAQICREQAMKSADKAVRAVHLEFADHYARAADAIAEGNRISS